MKIGIDARFLTHPQHGGFKSYTTTLIRSLAATDRENRYLLYTDRQAHPPVDLPSNFEVRTVSAPNAVIREQFALPRAMKRDGVELAHFPCNTSPVRLDMPMVVTILDAIPFHIRNGASGVKHKLLHAYWRSVIPRGADKSRLVITVSDYVADDLQAALRLPKGKIRVVKIAIDPAFGNGASGVPPSEIGPSERFLLAFASMDGRKNHLGAIQAFSVARKEFPWLKLALVCSHPDLRKTLEPVEGLAPIGPLDLPQLQWLYRNALGLVFPSFDEGFGLPPLESMASGTPVAASNQGSLPEIAGDCAIYVDPSDPASIARGIRALVSDEKLRTRLVKMGRERVSTLTYERMARDSIAVYSEAMNIES